ncbi:hypothetical protein [Methanobrevibacter arboriphilus]|uniref:hypothetical protein n=1 Tax=Methanobrevibacter arboriphilus TaxID=39441 RepID=UPI000A84BC56|nr:hypothetical protein [Methanobrevibacter arboriphilus]
MANGILAAILSLILPGLGQLYGGQGIMKTVVFLIIALIFLWDWCHNIFLYLVTSIDFQYICSI